MSKIDQRQFVCVPPTMAEQLLPRVREMLARGQKAGDQVYDEAATLTDLKNKHLLLWLSVRDNSKIEAALLTRLVHQHDGLTCCLIAVGGSNMRGWLHFMKAIEAYASREGCVKVRLEGRLGWRRVLPEFMQTGVILEKRIA